MDALVIECYPGYLDLDYPDTSNIQVTGLVAWSCKYTGFVTHI